MTKRINMFDVLKQTKSSKRDLSSGLLAAVIIVAALNLVVFAALFVPTMIKTQSIAKLNAYLSEPDAVKTEEDYASASDELEALNNRLAALDTLSMYYWLEPSFTSELYGKITACQPSNVTVQSFAFNSGSIVVNCTTPDNMPPADFTKALQDSGLFSSVKYAGFSTDSNGNVTFPIVCAMNIGGQ